MRSVVERLGAAHLTRTCAGVLGALAIVTAACGDSSSSRSLVGPGAGIDAAALAGNWSGTIAIPGANGTLTLRLVRREGPVSYSGTWTAMFDESSLNLEGTLTVVLTAATFPGTPPLPTLTVSLTPVPPPSCESIFGESVYLLTLGVVERNRMSGDGVFGSCAGRINLARVHLTR